MGLLSSKASRQTIPIIEKRQLPQIFNNPDTSRLCLSFLDIDGLQAAACVGIECSEIWSVTGSQRWPSSRGICGTDAKRWKTFSISRYYATKTFQSPKSLVLAPGAAIGKAADLFLIDVRYKGNVRYSASVGIESTGTQLLARSNGQVAELLTDAEANMMEPQDWTIELAVKTTDEKVCVLMISRATFIDDTELEDSEGGLVGRQEPDNEAQRRSVARMAIRASRTMRNPASRTYESSVLSSLLETLSETSVSLYKPILSVAVSCDGAPLPLRLGPFSEDITAWCHATLNLDLKALAEPQFNTSLTELGKAKINGYKTNGPFRELVINQAEFDFLYRAGGADYKKLTQSQMSKACCFMESN
mmetsp:Transcript_49294/g.111852  ORF Transcript_49294/g.111852 Transcript_49294/m.111852 type:complete len:361 (-) Transcript_49294:327-1409(-)